MSSIHASSCGNVERAILYAEKALQITSQQADGIDLKYIVLIYPNWSYTAGVNVQVFDLLRAHVIETMISCKLVEGKFTESLNLVCVYVSVQVNVLWPDV